jgi:hypothetical protein
MSVGARTQRVIEPYDSETARLGPNNCPGELNFAAHYRDICDLDRPSKDRRHPQFPVAGRGSASNQLLR